MTIGNNEVYKRCDLCGDVLEEGKEDIHELNKPYEFPHDIKWDGTKCTITNKVVRHICGSCLNKVMGAVKECMW